MDEAKPSAARPEPKRTLPLLRSWVADLVIAVAVSAFIILFLYQPVKVEGSSMQPLLNDQQRVFINKFVYHIGPIERGDIVVFRYPRDPSKSYIKRVIGVAGDRVRVEGGRVFLNGRELREPYVPPIYVDLHSYPEIVVPENSYFVLGDHRTMSNDSREFGPIPATHIYGKAVFVYWPVEKLGAIH
jgi:signal peptidase I